MNESTRRFQRLAPLAVSLLLVAFPLRTSIWAVDSSAAVRVGDHVGASADPGVTAESPSQAGAEPAGGTEKKPSFWSRIWPRRHGHKHSEEAEKKAQTSGVALVVSPPAQPVSEKRPEAVPSGPSGAVTRSPGQKREASGTQDREKPREPQDSPSGADGSLSKVQARLRQGPIGQDPTGRGYLEAVDRGEASADDMNDFAGFLAKRGFIADALQYQKAAVDADVTNPVPWINLGSLHRALQHFSEAMTAYERALRLDPNNAVAHYDIGSLLDVRGAYDRAIKEYQLALTLDPQLADPKVNPQVVNNARMLVVSLLVYQEKAGALGLPHIASRNTGPLPSKPQLERSVRPSTGGDVPIW